MSIRTKLLKISGPFFLLAFFCSYFLWQASSRMARALGENKLAGDIVQIATTRRGLLIEYLLYHSERVKWQWATTIPAFDNLLQPADFGDQSRQKLVAEINDNRTLAQGAFKQLIQNQQLYQEDASVSAQSSGGEAYLVQGILLRSQAVISRAYQLAELSQRELVTAQQHIMQVSLVLMVLLLLAWLWLLLVRL